jgi:O-antigen/teichoic acid export membrane protein
MFSFLIKGYAMMIQFALVPITLNFLDKFHYGIWLVLASILEWFAYFDIGIGLGLRNKLSEAIAHGDMRLGKILTSTAYALSTIIFSTLIFIFAIVNPLLDWGVILNVPAEESLELSNLVFFVFAFFCIRFVLGLITSIIFANQDPALRNLLAPIASTISLVSILLLSKYVAGSLFWIVIIFSGSPLLVMIITSGLLYYKRYKAIRPNIKYVDFSHSGKLLGLGFGFFIIQVSILVLFSSTNMVLTQLYGPEEVTNYNIAHKYFTIGILVNSIITQPYWSSFTEAFLKKETTWIKDSVRKLNIISYLQVGGQIVLLLIADRLIHLWVGEDITIPFLMKFMLTVYASIYLLAAPFNIFINGVGKIRLQLYMAVFSIVITIPLALFFSKTLNFGPPGVVVAMVCSTLPCGILWRIQYQKIIAGKATGIWNM